MLKVPQAQFLQKIKHLIQQLHFWVYTQAGTGTDICTLVSTAASFPVAER